MSEKTQAEILKEKLFYKRENVYDKMTAEEINEAFSYCDEYKRFLDIGKTERDAVNYIEKKALDSGFKPFVAGKSYNAGDKIYFNLKNKAAAMVVIGKSPLSEGVSIGAAHIDSPRLDLKPNPVYEDLNLCLFKTHYYGGIKKYQWTAIPLELRGVICKTDGTKIEVSIGEKDDDPVFTVTDLLPHLAKDQMAKTLENGVAGEALNLLVGSIPFNDDKASERVKLNILNLLFEKYNIVEKDFICAELEAVPAFNARDVGIDRGLIGAYGHDDRVCAYPTLTAITETNSPDKTCIALFADKEEIGSAGNTGLDTDLLKNIIISLARPKDEDYVSCFINSKCLSADVNCAIDPNYQDVYEKNNSSMVNFGTCVTKYTGARGKSSTNDASAELMSYFANLFDKNGIVWQTGELGKVDQGGGGTVAQYIAKLGIDVVDLGVPVLSMHSPFEVVSKPDVFMTHKALKVFFND